MRFRRAREIEFVRASSLRITTDGVHTVDEGITDDVPIVDPTGFKKLDHPPLDGSKVFNFTKKIIKLKL